MSVRRVYVEKKADYAVKAGELREELASYLGIEGLKKVRVLIRYDIENLSEEIYRKALVTIFSEPPVDELYEEEFPKNPGDLVFSVEYLPGQFDQRADSAEQCVKLLKEDEEPVIRTAVTYVITAPLTTEQEEAIRNYCVNPVDSRLTDEEKPETLTAQFQIPEDVGIFEGFCQMDEEKLSALYQSLNLAMTLADFRHIRNYFRFVWVYEAATVLESTLAHSLNAMGVPTLVVEMGVGMRITEQYVFQLVDGIFALMKEMGIWEGETAKPKEPIVSRDGEVGFVSAGRPGIFAPCVRHWINVEKGELIGRILNPLEGTVEEEVFSPLKGMLFTLREYPVVSPGSLLARVLGGDYR